ILDGGYNVIRIGYYTTVDHCAHHIRVKNSELRNAWVNGIGVCGLVGGNEFLNLDIHDNGLGGNITGSPHGLYIASANNLFDGIRVHHNVGGTGGNSGSSGMVIYNTGSTNLSNNIVRNSKFYDNTQSNGLTIGSGANNIVYNNLMYHNASGIGIGFG